MATKTALGKGKVEAALKQEIPVKTIVRVSRSIKPAYPDWMKKVMYPMLESTGRTDYDIAKDMLLWLHDEQQNGAVAGLVINKYLQEHNLLESCGNLQDALAIKKLGAATFKRVFGKKSIYFWKSVVQRQGGCLFVPSLCVDHDTVMLDWRWLLYDLGGGQPAVRFASSKS
ncbi:MAG: hypothetical protein WC289_00245 [Patescibacteria group bacterium]|jgi:hypothetical protein